MSELRNRAEHSLREKLREIGNPKEGEELKIQLTHEEAEIYGIEQNDEMTEEESLIESEGENE